MIPPHHPTPRRVSVTALLAVAILYTAGRPALAQRDDGGTARTRPARPQLRLATARGGITLDGRLDEAAWNTADSIADLTQIEPTEGALPSARTVVRFVATSEAIVIGVRADDPDPDAIVAFARQRDAGLGREDHIKIVLDTYLDGRSGYVFAVNPNGARYDALVSDQGDQENQNWDTIWDAAVTRDARGWSAEIWIPIKSLLFRPGLTQWGLNVQRRIARLQETSRWASPERDYDVSQTSRAGLLVDVPRFDLGLGLTLRPSVTGGGTRDSASARVRNLSRASLDLTQRLGTNTLASLTFNTDFAETEVDDRQVNLSRFPLFFPEKRTFFLEGADIFDFGTSLGRDVVPFFSRRIGLLDGQQIPIAAGGKVNGRIGSTNFGALTVHTRDLDTLTTSSTMAVVRVQQNVLRESSAGFIATLGDPLGRRGGWLAGPDVTFRTSHFRGDKNFVAGAWALAAGREGIAAGDRSAAGATVRYPNDLWDASVNYKRIGDAFDPSLGFVPRSGVHLASGNIDWRPRPANGLGLHVRQCMFENRGSYVAGLDGVWQSYRYFAAPVNCRFESGDRIELNVVPTGERLDESFEVADGVVIPAGAYHYTRYRAEASLASKRKVSGQGSWWFGRFYTGSLDQYELSVEWKPAPLLIFGLDAERNVGHLPTGHFTQDVFGSRVRLNFSPDLQITSLVQYDNESETFGTNTRLRWTFNPLGDVYVVYNHNIETRDPLTLQRALLFQSNQLLVKVQYAFRY